MENKKERYLRVVVNSNSYYKALALSLIPKILLFIGLFRFSHHIGSNGWPYFLGSDPFYFAFHYSNPYWLMLVMNIGFLVGIILILNEIIISIGGNYIHTAIIMNLPTVMSRTLIGFADSDLLIIALFLCFFKLYFLSGKIKLQLYLFVIAIVPLTIMLNYIWTGTLFFIMLLTFLAWNLLLIKTTLIKGILWFAGMLIGLFVIESFIPLGKDYLKIIPYVAEYSSFIKIDVMIFLVMFIISVCIIDFKKIMYINENPTLFLLISTILIFSAISFFMSRFVIFVIIPICFYMVHQNYMQFKPFLVSALCIFVGISIVMFFPVKPVADSCFENVTSKLDTTTYSLWDNGHMINYFADQDIAVYKAHPDINLTIDLIESLENGSIHNLSSKRPYWVLIDDLDIRKYGTYIKRPFKGLNITKGYSDVIMCNSGKMFTGAIYYP